LTIVPVSFLMRMNTGRAFTPPWTLDEGRESFIIRDAKKGQALAYVYHQDETGRRMAMGRLTRDEARRIALNIAKLPDLLMRPQSNMRKTKPRVAPPGFSV
jgi:hypothetical protein